MSVSSDEGAGLDDSTASALPSSRLAAVSAPLVAALYGFGALRGAAAGAEVAGLGAGARTAAAFSAFRRSPAFTS